MFKKFIFLASVCLVMSSHAFAQACYKTSILAPAPFMGNHGEVFKLSDGSMWKVMGSYEYMYAYYPAVNICPGSGKLIVEGRAVNVMQVKGGSNAAGSTTPDQIVTTLWTNVIGSAPGSADKAPFIQMLASGTKVGDLAVMAADTSFNTTNINLTGLAQTGIEYTPA